MADFSMSDMPWLGQPADPAGSLLRGVQAGAAISGARTQRAALAQRKMEFDQERSMAERNWRERMAVLPLEMTLKQQEVELNKFRIEELLRARQDRIGNEATLLELNKNVARSFSEADGPETAQQMLFESLTKNPRLVTDPRFKELRAMVDTSLAAKEQLIRLRNERAGVEGLGGVSIVTDPLTGEQKTYVRESTGTIAPFQKTDPNKPQSTMGKLIADRNTAKLAGDAEAVSAFDAEIKMRQTKDGFSITTNPDGTVTVTQGAKSGGLPASVVSNAEEKITGAVNAVRLGGALVNKLRPEDLGVLGKGGEIVVDESLAQMFPGLANKQRIDSRTLLRLFINDFTMALKDPGTMSNQDRQRIEAMLPSLDAKESLPDAIQKIKSATKEAATRSRFAAERAGRPLPNELLKPAELMEKVKRGEITVQQATELAKNSPFRDEYDDLLPK